MELFFWLLVIAVLYCYFGYPLVLTAVATVIRRASKKDDQIRPVSLILSVWNEEDVIGQKLENLLSLDYPADKTEILIGSDGSTDGTNEIIKKCRDPRIRLSEGKERKGKMDTINALVAGAKNEIIIFTDARQRFDASAIRKLVRNFADPKIGCVSGELVFREKAGATAQGINLYWNYEKFIRDKESRVHSMLGATGAIYAIRRELFTEIPDNIVLDDMFVPLKIIEKGYRAITDYEARAFDEVADSPREEHRRKSRTLFGNYQIFWVFRNLFIPFKSPVAFQLFSHKLLRVLIPFFMIALYFMNWALAGRETYGTLLILQNVFYGMAVIGSLARYQKYGILRFISNICYIPYVFCLLNFSALIGFLRFAGAKQDIKWDKARD